VNANRERHSEVKHYRPGSPCGQIKQVGWLAFMKQHGPNDPSQPIEEAQTFVSTEDPDIDFPLQEVYSDSIH